ncbi:MAG: thioredoxin-dependent thiol peroxidase [Candidatus Hydrogenedentota bacterium]
MSENAIPVVGKKARAFNLETDQGTKLRLSSLLGSPVVLYFYPKDNTPGCTTEAQEFRDAHKKFAKLGVRVLGLSPDSATTHEKFVAKQKLNFTLISDPDHKMIEKYGLWVEKKLYGRVYWGVQRATLLIDAKGKVARVWEKVKPKGHAAEVLDAARDLLGD